MRTPLPWRVVQPPFVPRVAHVVEAGAQEEMIGSDARRDVAAVADHHPIGDWADVQLPRYSVRLTPPVTAANAAHDADQAVSLAAAVPNPEPATRCLVGAPLAREALSQRCGATHAASSRTPTRPRRRPRSSRPYQQTAPARTRASRTPGARRARNRPGVRPHRRAGSRRGSSDGGRARRSPNRPTRSPGRRYPTPARTAANRTP